MGFIRDFFTMLGINPLTEKAVGLYNEPIELFIFEEGNVIFLDSLSNSLIVGGVC